MTERILVVDDDPGILNLLKRGLSYAGYTIDAAGDGVEALAKAMEREPDLVVLDIMMPELDGMEVCRRLRQASDTPVLMLTAKGTVADRIAGLDGGADDYLVKPFSLDELMARIRALLRRHTASSGEILRFSDLSLNTVTREVKRGNRSIELTAQEFDLLKLFLMHPRQVLARDFIYEKVWGYDFGGDSNVIEVYVRYLRSKLEADNQPRLVHTVRRAGYVLKE